MAKSRPYIILSGAVSIDGKIASKTRNSGMSSKTDLIRVHKLRSNVDAILVGKNTVEEDNPLLTVRYTKGKNPTRIILDSAGSISLNSKIVQTSKKIPTIIVTTSQISPYKKLSLEKNHIKLIVNKEKTINLRNLLSILKKHGIKKILVEGGGITNWEFISKKLFDEIIVTITPILLGGNDAVSFVNGIGFSKIFQSPKLKLNRVHRQGNEMVLYYTKL